MNITFTKTSVLVASQNQVSANLSTDISENAVILDLKKGTYYELCDVGARIWALIQQPCSVQSILDKLLDEYEVDAERCEADLLALTENLAKFGLVEIKIN